MLQAASFLAQDCHAVAQKLGLEKPRIILERWRAAEQPETGDSRPEPRLYHVAGSEGRFVAPSESAMGALKLAGAATPPGRYPENIPPSRLICPVLLRSVPAVPRSATRARWIWTSDPCHNSSTRCWVRRRGWFRVAEEQACASNMPSTGSCARSSGGGDCFTSARARAVGWVCWTPVNVRRHSPPIPKWSRRLSPAAQRPCIQAVEGAEDNREAGVRGGRNAWCRQARRGRRHRGQRFDAVCAGGAG
jgi:hypothetical protein